MSIQYPGRTGRPYEYMTVTLDQDMPDEVGGIYVATGGAIEFLMKNGSGNTITFPTGVFIPGDFRRIVDDGIGTVFAVLIST